MKKFTVALKILLLIGFCSFFTSLTPGNGPDEMAGFIQQSLNKYYNKNAESGAIKRVDLQITNTGFCRYKKYFTNGKTEYFAFNVNRLKSIDYLGTENTGNLLFRTLEDDVIVQTYNDKKGDIDTMGTYVTIPLKNINAEDLNQISAKILDLKKSVGK